MWGPYFGHTNAIFWPLLKRGLWDTPRIVKLGMEHPWANDYDSGRTNLKDHVLAIKGPYFCHLYKRWLQDTPNNVKFGMKYPWAHWLRIRKNQFEGPCFGHKMAIFWPFLGKEATGYTQQCEIWHWVSLGTLIKNQEEPLLGTIWGPCFVHKRAIFWQLLRKATWQKQQCEIWHGEFLG